MAALYLVLCRYFAPSSASGHTHLLIGQNWQKEFYDYSSFFGQLPSGPSFYTAQLVSGQPLVWMGDGLPFVYDVLNGTYKGRGANAELTLAWKYAKGGCKTIRQTSIDIATGLYDTQLDEMVTVFNTFPEVTFLLRVEYEVSYQLFTCEAPSKTCSDTTYQHAFQHVATYLRSKAKNVRFVFHVMYGDVDAPCLYPGDDAVDVIGVSFFEGKGDPCYHRQVDKCVDPPVNATLAWARSTAPDKDLFFPESTPQDIDNPEWIVTFLEQIQSLVEMYDIRYWTYINMDWNKHGWGPKPWGNSRVQDSNVTSHFWRRTILNSSGRYLCADNLPCGSHPSPPSPAPSPPTPSPSPKPPSTCVQKCSDKHCSSKIHYPFCCATNGTCYISRQQAASAGCKVVCGPYVNRLEFTVL